MVFTLRAMIEVLGKPESHVVEVINKVIEKLKTEKGVELLKHEISNAELIKEQFYSIFAQVEVKIMTFSGLLNFCYDYLPSSIEILDTEKVAMSAREFSNGLNESLIKLHQYNLMVNNLIAKSKPEEEKK